MSMSNHYDLIALGGGSGGLAVARCAIIEPNAKVVGWHITAPLQSTQPARKN